MKKTVLLLLVVLLVLSGCATAQPALKGMTLNGTTGFGFAKLISEQKYEISVETDASNVSAALLNGSVDVGALPTSAAANLYQKSGGKITVLCLNTLGVLYLCGEGVSSLSDLQGKTVFVPAGNPTQIVSALCKKAGVQVEIDNSYAQPADLRTALVAEKVALAVLPEPMVTIATSANPKIKVALDLTAEWDKVFPQGSLVQGCVVARTDYVNQNKAQIDAFLQEYEASVAFLTADPKRAGELIQEAGIFANAEVAQKAIPRCNVCFITGKEMQTAFETFLTALGQALPDDSFYYEAK